MKNKPISLKGKARLLRLSHFLIKNKDITLHMNAWCNKHLTTPNNFCGCAIGNAINQDLFKHEGLELGAQYVFYQSNMDAWAVAIFFEITEEDVFNLFFPIRYPDAPITPLDVAARIKAFVYPSERT